MDWTHETLAADLAHMLRGNAYAKPTYFVGRECNLGSSWMDNGVPRADVLAVKPSYTKFAVHIYECKASRADFHADVNAGKWRSYLPFCHRLYFAAPQGVLSKSDIPEGCGLYIRGDKGWSCVQQCKPRGDISFSVDTLLGILVTCGNREVRQRHSIDLCHALYSTDGERKRAKIIGKANAQRLASLEELEGDARRAKEKYEESLERIARALGVDIESVKPWELPKALAEAARSTVQTGMADADKVALAEIAEYLKALPGEDASAIARHRPRFYK